MLPTCPQELVPPRSTTDAIATVRIVVLMRAPSSPIRKDRNVRKPDPTLRRRDFSPSRERYDAFP